MIGSHSFHKSTSQPGKIKLRIFLNNFSIDSQSGLGACGAGPTCEACRRLARFARDGSLRSLEKCLLFCKRGSLRSQKNLIRLQFSFLQSGFHGPNGLCHCRLNDPSSLNGIHGLNSLSMASTASRASIASKSL